MIILSTLTKQILYYICYLLFVIFEMVFLIVLLFAPIVYILLPLSLFLFFIISTLWLDWNLTRWKDWRIEEKKSRIWLLISEKEYLKAVRSHKFKKCGKYFECKECRMKCIKDDCNIICRTAGYPLKTTCIEEKVRDILV